MNTSNIKHLLFASFFLLCTLPSQAQKKQLSFENFTVSDGLSQNDITCIAQDSLGFLWFGTNNGLNKYDGYTFVTYKHEMTNPTSISNSVITAIDVAPDGRVWVGTIDGLNVYDSRKDQFERISEEDSNKEHAHNREVSFIQTLPSGEQWVGVGNKISRYVEEKNKFVTYPILYDRSVLNRIAKNYCIAETSPNTLWVGNSYGLYLFDKREEMFQHVFPLPNNKEEENRSNQKVYYIQEKRDELVLLLATSNGLISYNYETGDSREILYNKKTLGQVKRIHIDKQNNIWVATQTNGLFLLREDTLYAYKHSSLEKTTLSSNQLTTVFVDHFHNLWVGTTIGGINKAPLNKQDYMHLAHSPNDKESLSDNVVRSILAEGDSIVWIGTEMGVLNKLEKKTGRIKHFRLEPTSNENFSGPPRITAITRGEHNHLWIATGIGLYHFDKKSGKFYPEEISLDKKNTSHKYQNMINGITVDDKDNLWCSFPLGIIIFQKDEKADGFIKRNMRVPNALINNDVQTIYQDKRGDVWIGSRAGGLSRYTGDIEKHTFEYYDKDGSLFNSNNISALFEDSKHRFWVGTWGGGLSLLDRDSKQVISYTASSGLLDNTIFSISEDAKGRLWISTYEGLSCFDVESNTFKNRRFRDGREIFEITYGANDIAADNTIYLGSNEGLIMYNPDEQHAQNQRHNIVFTALTVNGKQIGINEVGERSVPICKESITTTPKITLSYKDKQFSIAFTDFITEYAHENRFAYKMDGFDDNWIKTSKHTVNYTNLFPGEYTFMVQSVDNNGKLLDNITQVEVVIEPPFWNTIYARIIYLILILVSLYMLYRYIAQREKKKQVYVREEAERELYEDKMRFFMNISHEIRTPLTLILAPINRIKEALKGDETLSRQVEIMDHNGDRLLRMVNQLLNLQKMETGSIKVHLHLVDIVSFTKKVFAYFGDVCQRNNITMITHCQYQKLECQIDEDKVEKILYNLLSNAIKYAKSYIEVSIELDNSTIDNEKITISIKDDGKGISKPDMEKIFQRFYQAEDKNENYGSGIGLHLVQEFAKMMNGAVTGVSEEGKGAQFMLSIPYLKAEITTATVSSIAYEEDEHIDMLNRKPLVLIVEDNNDIRSYLHTILDDMYEVKDAINGVEGDILAQELLPDIIISDVMMPDKNGIEMSINLKNNTQTKHIPIIMLTAKSSDDSKKQGLDAGADVYITKPFGEGVLKAQICRILSSKEELRQHLLREVLVSPQKFTAESPENIFLGKVVKIIDTNIAEPTFDVDTLSQEVGMSRVHLYRTFRSLIGRTPSDFIKDFRLQRAVDILEENTYNINEIAYMTGFNDPKYFTINFKKKYGVTPTEYRNRLKST